jgi:tripartite-type tricarboxylate transporter receptor subunit TctC
MFRVGLLVVMASAVAATSADAQSSVSDFYRNKSIDVYAGFSVGGVYDMNARLLSRFMGRYIPGSPNLVPRNMVGAAGVTLANWLYQVAPKDGLAFGTFARGIAFNPLLGQSAGPIEAAKFNWLGSTNDEVSVCVARSESGITKFEQVFDRELVVGSTGSSGDDDQFPKTINGVLGTKFRTVRGFPGGNESAARSMGVVAGRGRA